MSASVWTETSDLSSAADTALKMAARFWFVVAVAGQWFFVAYVIAFYGGAAVRGDLAAWNKVLPNGYTPGNLMANLAVAVHLLLAVIIMVGGPLQFIPRIRQRAPRFHRWSGRIYIPAVILTSIAGLYMVWSRARPAHLVQHLGISLDAILIVTFSILALRYAMARDIRTHRRWALRLFMVVNAGWFFRIGLMEWVFLNRGPIGFDPNTFTGPFLNFLSFADYLLPLAILEIYLRTKERAGPIARFAVAATLVVLTIGMGVGIFAAAMGMWLPRM
ncbi:MAG: DUF2306 domain-containing protein [Acidobacteriota bacterium]|nr:DUF2306 domain-containing protein [Acidobacteriota bacterium]